VAGPEMCDDAAVGSAIFSRFSADLSRFSADFRRGQPCTIS
jgi:hypothetical protein